MGGEITLTQLDAIRAAAYTEMVHDDHEYAVEPMHKSADHCLSVNPRQMQRGIGGAPTRATVLPCGPAERKQFPMASGLLDYFPDALAVIANVSWQGNEQHNPGKPLHWDRSKSADEADTLIRHFAQRGSRDTDGIRHSAKMAWRALALLQKELEQERETTQAAEKPARAGTRNECPAYGSSDGKHFWGCEREAGHSGNHMAWDDYMAGILYEGGSWK